MCSQKKRDAASDTLFFQNGTAIVIFSEDFSRPLQCRSVFHLLLYGIFYVGVKRNARLTSQHGRPTMNGRGYANVQNSSITFVWFNTLILAKSQVVIYGLMERFGQVFHAFALEIDHSVNPLYLTKENSVFLTECHRTEVAFITHCIHFFYFIKPDSFNSSYTCFKA